MWKSLKARVVLVRQEIRIYELVRQDPRTPRLAKLLIGLAIAYALSPIDIIPDFIPVIGHLDDAVIVPALIFTALKLIPADVVAECRARIAAE
jgi:uncharacterized membrane protein YkvA (DUF1232 family)